MTDTFAQPSRTARIRRLLTTLLLTAALVAAVAAANTTASTADDGWWPRTGDAFTATATVTPPDAGAPAGPLPAACGVGLDRTTCTHPAAADEQAPVLAAPVTPSVWTTALLLLPVAAGLTVVARTRPRDRARKAKR
ncbi:hypothetical protein GCM10017562_01610 [Streptomyces roseofulvus]|uniref:hypothetical protein n=1 Tax=Streptomyces roseofulvus TaxID=33902 RepID=UPI0031F93405